MPGIEHSQIKRVKLFSEMGYRAKIVTMSHGLDLYENAEQFSISDHIFSMYDYFQEAMGNNYYTQKKYYEIWKNNDDYSIELVPKTNDLKLYYKGDYICYVHFYDKNYERVSYINYFDGPYKNRRKVKRELFDTRGFLSNVKILGEKQRVISESFFSPSGSEKICCFYNDKNQLSRVQLNDYKNETYYFKNKDEWQAFFLDELNQANVLFFSDRTQSIIDSTRLMKTKAKFIPVIHNVHLRAPFNTKKSEITSPYQALFLNLEKVKAVVASTKHQAKELNDRLPSHIKAYPIPVGYLETKQEKINFKERNPYKLVCMARYFSEKQLLHQIKIVQRLLGEFPKLELHLFGYGNKVDGFKEEKMLKKYVNEHCLEKHIFFRGYLSNLDEEYNSAGMMLLTSSIEGFCLSMLEAIEHGVPVISYDIRYGPSEMVEDGKNGYLIQKNDINGMQEKLQYVLRHPELHKEMSLYSYEVSEKFDKQCAMEKWRELIAIENK